MSYQLLDSGDERKLERINGFTIIRPSPISIYPVSNPSIWKNPDAEYIRSNTGGGTWKFHVKNPESMVIPWEQFKIQLKLTPFGHIGIFPEQSKNWTRINQLTPLHENSEILNLFSYSGLSSLYLANRGFSVCHLDASAGMVEWAKENFQLSRMSHFPVRWIVDDVLKFVKREIRRNKKYSGFVLDPPSFGRGTKGEIWKLENHLRILMESLMELCNNKPDFMILTSHTQGYNSLCLERILKSHIKSKGKFISEEMFIEEESGMRLPGGFSASFFSEKYKIV